MMVLKEKVINTQATQIPYTEPENFEKNIGKIFLKFKKRFNL